MTVTARTTGPLCSRLLNSLPGSCSEVQNSQILLTPGNNDNECGDYDIEADGPFLSDTADLAGNLARWPEAASLMEWKALGSYTIQPRAIRGLRILSLNSVFFSNEYQAASFDKACSPVDSTAPTRTFTWLASNLAQARQAHEKVWLMFHIPPGIDGYATMMQYRRMAAAPTHSLKDLCSRHRAHVEARLDRSLRQPAAGVSKHRHS